MDRQYFLDLAARGLKMPIGADLVLRENADAEAILRDGPRLGRVVAEAARRFRSPLAIPVMDLTLEKEALLELLGIPTADIPTFHFPEAPTEEQLARAKKGLTGALPGRLAAHCEAVRYVASQPDLLAIGMVIGPFSLMTKLIADPIVPVYMAGTGVTGTDNPDVLTVERCLALAIDIVIRSVEQQVRAGAKAIFIAEPAANKIYISPRQMDKGSDIFDRYVMTYNRQVKSLLNANGAELFFHCCGELSLPMLRSFVELDPAILSLGSSRVLWEDAAAVPKTTVLFGNLPSKKFFSDREFPLEEVRQRGGELLEKMRDAGHPFILGSECDVLSVPGCEETIRRKAMAILDCGCS